VCVWGERERERERERIIAFENIMHILLLCAHAVKWFVRDRTCVFYVGEGKKSFG